MKATNTPMRWPMLAGAVMLAGVGIAMAPANAEPGRYQMQPTEDGLVRMDTQTGEMSVCKMQADEVICRLGADERGAFLDALDGLEARVEVLERRLNASGSAAIARDGLPDSEEFERGMGYMEEFFRRFLGIVEEFEHRDENRT